MGRTSGSSLWRRCSPCAFLPARARLLAAGPLLGLLAAGSASALAPDKQLHQFPLRGWQVEDGLPQNTAIALAQTPDGYLWVGTLEGLARFDGVRFKVFDPTNTPALSDRSISALAVDAEGTLWISTHRGLTGMREGHFFPVRLPEGIVAREVHQLVPAREGGLWLVTLGSGLARLSEGRFQLWKVEQGLASNRVLALAEGQSGNLWVATTEGLQRWSGSAFSPGPTFQDAVPRVSMLMVDTKGTLWAGDQGGIVYREKDGQMVPVPEASMPGSTIAAIREDRHGALWVASRGQGLLRLLKGQRSILGAEQGLESGSVFTLLEDSEGDIWLGMGTRGLQRLKDAPFTPYGPLDGLGDVVGSVREARDGSLWFATLGGGITRLKDGVMTTWTKREGLLDNVVFGSAEGRDGSLWFTTSKGLIHWREDQFTQLPEQGLRVLRGQPIYEDEHGTLWVGTQEGLSRWDGKQLALVSPQDPVLGAYVRVMERRAAGGFWIGTHGGGLGWLDAGRLSPLSSQGTPIDGDVRSIFEEGDTLWVGTTNGLFRWKEGRFVHLSREQGLFDDVILQILPDERGDVWMSCNKGIFRVSRRELEAVAEGQLARVTSRVYGREDGMRTQECNALGGPSGVRTRDGRLWFPTMHGAVAYDPRHEKKPAAPPPVLLEELWVDGHLVPVSEWSHIPPGERRVELHYTSMALSSAERLRFRYKLEGVDADWLDAGSRRIAYYTRLPPGEHRFLVEVSSTEGEGLSRRAGFVFYLEPRLLERRLFRAGLALAAVLLVAGMVWLRLHQSRQREQLLQTRVDERTAELAMRLRQLESAQEQLAHAKKLVAVVTLAAGVGHEVNNPLAYILSNLRFLAREMREVQRSESEHERWQEMEEALSDALHGAERVRKIVQALRALARVQAAPTSPVELHTVLDQALEEVEPNLRRRARLVKAYSGTRSVLGDEARLSQVFLNLLVNAVQALPEGAPEHNEIRVATREDGDGRIVVEVSDTGHGIEPELLPRIFEPFFTTREAGEGTGLGLSICHAIIASMGGEIEVESELGRGATFRVLLHAPGVRQIG